MNKDQLEILAKKDQVLAPLKELQNLAEQFTEIENEQKGSSQAEAAELNKSKSAAVAAAKEEGLNEGKKVVKSLIAFLGYASLLRITPTVSSRTYKSCLANVYSLILTLTRRPSSY